MGTVGTGVVVRPFLRLNLYALLTLQHCSILCNVCDASNSTCSPFPPPPPFPLHPRCSQQLTVLPIDHGEFQGSAIGALFPSLISPYTDCFSGSSGTKVYPTRSKTPSPPGPWSDTADT